MNVARLRLLALRMGYAIETAAQFNHATTRRIRRGFARHMLAELRAMHTELITIHREAWNEDAPVGSPPSAPVETPEQRAALIASRRRKSA